MSVGCPRSAYRVSLDSPWGVSRESMGCPRGVHRAPLGCPWASHGQHPMEHAWGVHRVSVVGPRGVRGYPIGPLWAIHHPDGLPTGCASGVRRMSVRCLWGARGVSLDSS